MVQKCLVGSGGGNVPIAVGTINASTAGEYTVNDVGFKASKLYIYNNSTPSAEGDWPSGTSMIYYDEDLSPSYQYRTLVSTSITNQVKSMPTTTNNQVIRDITNTGFTLSVINACVGTYTYVAIGQ